MHLVRAEKDQVFADEPVQHRQAHRAQRHKKKKRRVFRHRRGQAAVFADLIRVSPVVEYAGQEEQRAGRNPVRQHLVHRALHGNRLERENPQHHEAQVADRRVRHKFFQVRLHQRNQRTVNNADDRQHRYHGSCAVRRLRKQRQAEADHAVGSHLQQHARENDRAGRWRFHVRVRQPGVKREERHLDRKGHEEGKEEQHLRPRRKMESRALQRQLNGRQVKRAGQVIKPQDADQHERRAEHRIDEEFHRGINPPVVAPDADQERHRDQHHFPEKEENEKVQRQEHADDADFQQQQHHVEFLDAVMHALPRSQHADRRQQRGQDHQEHADPIHAQVVIDRRGRNPRLVLGQRIARRADGHHAQQNQ